MKKLSKKGYVAPWSSRRETAGLMGTFFIFLLGLPGHSELTVSQAQQMVRQFIQLVLVFLGLSTPVAQVPKSASIVPAIPVHEKPFHPHAVVKKDINSMILRSENLHRFNYIFEGKATLHSQPCPSASVLVRLVSGDKTVTKGGITEADGSYSIQTGIDAELRAPVDWTVEAYTPDFDKVELFGRKIVQHEEEDTKEPIVVNNPVSFVISLAK